jgi:hypothetical protein
MLPVLSIAIPYGLEPVEPRAMNVPFGVIFVTLFELPLAV